MLGNSYLMTVALGSALVGLLSGITGTFAVLRKESLIGDAVSHSALPGIVIAFMLMGVKLQAGLLLGAIVSGMIAVWLIVSISEYSKITFDTALALTLSTFFGLGMVLLGIVQRSANANQAGLDSYIFGQAATFVRGDMYPLTGVLIITLAVVLIMYKEFKVYCFDEEYAATIGYSTKFIGTVLSLLVVMTIVVGLQTVGVILMSAMLIGPASAARQWSDRLWVNLVLAAVIGFFSGITGTVLSVEYKLPTGPAIVMVLMSIVLISLLFAPRRGIIAKSREKKRRLEKSERLLVLYMVDHLMHTERATDKSELINALNAKKFSYEKIERYIDDELRSGRLQSTGDGLILSESGHDALREEGLLWTHMYKSR